MNLINYLRGQDPRSRVRHRTDRGTFLMSAEATTVSVLKCSSYYFNSASQVTVLQSVIVQLCLKKEAEVLDVLFEHN